MTDNKTLAEFTPLKVLKKVDDKWLSFGNIKKNQWGNPSLGLHCTALFKKTVADTPEGGWINFALFEDNKK